MRFFFCIVEFVREVFRRFCEDTRTKLREHNANAKGKLMQRVLQINAWTNIVICLFDISRISAWGGNWIGEVAQEDLAIQILVQSADPD